MYFRTFKPFIIHINIIGQLVSKAGQVVKRNRREKLGVILLCNSNKLFLGLESNNAFSFFEVNENLITTRQLRCEVVLAILTERRREKREREEHRALQAITRHSSPEPVNG